MLILFIILIIILIVLIYKNQRFVKIFILENKNFFVIFFLILFLIFFFSKFSVINLNNDENLEKKKIKNEEINLNNITIQKNNEKNLNKEENLQNQIIDEIDYIKNNFSNTIQRFEGDFMEYQMVTLKKFNYLTKEEVEKIFLELGINKEEEGVVQNGTTKCEVLDAYLNCNITKEKLIKMNEEIFKIELANEETIFDHSPEEFYNYYVKLYNENKFIRYDKVNEDLSQIDLFLLYSFKVFINKFQKQFIDYMIEKDWLVKIDDFEIEEKKEKKEDEKY